MTRISGLPVNKGLKFTYTLKFQKYTFVDDQMLMNKLESAQVTFSKKLVLMSIQSQKLRCKGQKRSDTDINKNKTNYTSKNVKFRSWSKEDKLCQTEA